MKRLLASLALLALSSALGLPFNAKQLYGVNPTEQDAACTAGFQDGKAGTATPKLARYTTPLGAAGVVRGGAVQSGLGNFYTACQQEVQRSGNRAQLPTGRSNLQEVTVTLQVTAASKVVDAWPVWLRFLDAGGKEITRIDPVRKDADFSEDKCDASTGKCSFKGTLTYAFGTERPPVMREQVLQGVTTQVVLQTPSGKVTLPVTFK